METYVRGFSFMGDMIDKVDLQFLEGGELERTWKNAQRERAKLREQKIWDEFVNEKDIVNSVCEDDKYQFLEPSSNDYMKEMIDNELERLRNEVKSEKESKIQTQVSTSPQLQLSKSSIPPLEDNQHTCVVTFSDDNGKEGNDMFHIFDDGDFQPPGLEEDGLNDSMHSLPTVRERQAELAEDMSPQRPDSGNNTSSTAKSSENVTDVIESSIYCAKVKDIRLKINEEILNMITSLDRRDVFSMEQEDMARMLKRSVEFCTRFNRIYMYQLQRQMHDIKRNNTLALPFAKHTQFQSQMLRIVSLHQNLLQSFQVFRKSVDQTWCVREGVSALGALVGAARATTLHCAAINPPKGLTAAQELYNDNMLSSCDKLEDFVNEYTIRCEEFLNSFVNLEGKQPKKTPKSSKTKTKKRPIGPSRISPKDIEPSRLSMYALDTLRLNTKNVNKDTQSSTAVKSRVGIPNSANNANKKGAETTPTEQMPKSQRKSPRSTISRRPLMRDPMAGRARAPRPPRAVRGVRDHDVSTMVEAVEAVISPSHLSREPSPQASPQPKKSHTPRGQHTSSNQQRETSVSKKPQLSTPRKERIQHPKIHREPIPKPLNLGGTMSFIMSAAEEVDSSQVTPVCKINCSKKKPSTENKETEVTDSADDDERCKTASKSESSRPEALKTPKSLKSPKLQDIRNKRESEKNEGGKSPGRSEVTKLLKQICSKDSSSNRAEHTSGAKNAQLVCVTNTSPCAQPITPQLLKILEETIQKKIPETRYHKSRELEKYYLNFNIAETITDNLFQYRTKFVQHMLTSPMYANSAVGKPWEMIGSVSEQIIDEVLLNCVKEMQLTDVIKEMYTRETSLP